MVTIIIIIIKPSFSCLYFPHQWVPLSLKLIHPFKKKKKKTVCLTPFEWSYFSWKQILPDLNDLKNKLGSDKKDLEYWDKKFEFRPLKYSCFRSSSLNHHISQNSNMYTESPTCPQISNLMKCSELEKTYFKKLR